MTEKRRRPSEMSLEEIEKKLSEMLRQTKKYLDNRNMVVSSKEDLEKHAYIYFKSQWAKYRNARRLKMEGKK